MRNIRSRQKAQIHWDKVSSTIYFFWKKTIYFMYVFIYFFSRIDLCSDDSALAPAPFIFLKCLFFFFFFLSGIS